MSGVIELYKAKKREVKPIIGVETYVAPRGHLDKAGRQEVNPYYLILIAYNNVGYHNLMKLVTIAQLDGYYYKPRVDRDGAHCKHNPPDSARRFGQRCLSRASTNGVRTTTGACAPDLE